MKHGISTTLIALSLVSACRPNAVPIAAVVPPPMEERQDVAARARILLGRHDHSPGRELMNRLRSEDYPDRLGWLSDPARTWSQPDIEKYNDYCSIVRSAEAGRTWPVPGTVRVPRARSGIKLDGDLSDPEWSNAFTWGTSYAFNQTTPAPDTKTVWKLLWDQDHLYVGYVCSDERIRSGAKPRDSEVYNDDCVELFISPDIRFRSYWEIIVNPDGSIFDSIEAKHIDRWGADLNPSADIPELTSGVTRIGPDGLPGYTIELSIPWSSLLAQPGDRVQPGHRYAFMLARLDWTGDVLTPFSPVPLMGWAHNIWNMATLELVE